MNSMKKTEKNDAVSPVVGVMLMLVVTIIIAAIVASFAGGLADNTNAAPSAVIKLDDYTFGTVNQSAYGSEWSTYKEGWFDYGPSPYGGSNSNYAVYKMTFSHKGGEALSISSLILRTTFNGATYDTPLKDVLEDDKVTTLSAGKKVELSAEKGKEITGKSYKYGLNQQSVLDGPTSYLDWEIMDSTSSYVVSSGRINFEKPTPVTSTPTPTETPTTT